MKFEKPLQRGVFLKRYKRFFADIEWDGQIITAHVANTGSLRSCSEPGSPCLFSTHDDPKRKLKYSLEMIQAPSGSWVGINTSWPNKLIKQALSEPKLSHWQGWDEVKPEFKINSESRLDFRLSKKNKQHFIEVKNVTLVEDTKAMFPDAVTKRGQKHLKELMKLMEEGHQAEIVFVVQRNDGKNFSPADEIDPTYGQLLREAAKKGLRITVLPVNLSESGLSLDQNELPVDLK